MVTTEKILETIKDVLGGHPALLLTLVRLSYNHQEGGGGQEEEHRPAHGGRAGAHLGRYCPLMPRLGPQEDKQRKNAF